MTGRLLAHPATLIAVAIPAVVVWAAVTVAAAGTIESFSVIFFGMGAIIWATNGFMVGPRPASAGRVDAPEPAPVAGAPGAGGRHVLGGDVPAAHKPPAASEPAGSRRTSPAAAPGPAYSDVSTFAPGRATVGAASQPAAPTTLVLPAVVAS